MAFSPEKENQNSLWFKHKKAFNNVLLTMRRHSLTSKQTQRQNQRQRPPLSEFPQPTSKIRDFPLTTLVSDITSLLSDEILLKILARVPISQRNSNFLVSKRWLNLQGRLVRSIKILDWDFLVSGRLFLRFPNLIRVHLVNGCLISSRNFGVICTHKTASFHVGSDVEVKDWFFNEKSALKADEVDRGLKILASGCPNLRTLTVMNASEMGVLSVAEECPTLQELELHMCNDQVLRGIAACQNLQFLKLSGAVDDSYNSLVSDLGLTILAQGCKKLVKVELSRCRGSFEGIKALGQCCQTLEELIICDHRMSDGWIFALPYCKRLKTLRFLSCQQIDRVSGADEHLGSCSALENLHMEKCQLRDKRALGALFVVCQNVRDVVLKNCWGVDDDMFSTASAFRRVRSLYLEGCSLLTTDGLDSVITSWNELQNLKVKSCNNIKDCAPSSVFSYLKDLKWKPDSKSILSANLAGTGMGKKGCRLFKRSCDWKSLPGA